MIHISENIDSKDLADTGLSSPLFSEESMLNDLLSPSIVSPSLLPINLFPDPAQLIIDSMKLSKISETAGTEEAAASMKALDTPESDNSKTNRPVHDIADIFRLYWKDYQFSNLVTPRQYKVVYDILNCRTGSFGYSISACDSCGHTEIFPNSCRNSHCPKCQGNKRMEWVDARIDDLLPVPYYHSVFTLPNSIFPFCLYNQKIVYDLLIHSAAETLQQFGLDPKWLGGKIGIIMVLHTWGQQLPVHPHVHCMIPGGAYDEKECEWVWPKYEKDNFLFPVHALSKVFRGKFICGLKEAFYKGNLDFPGDLEPLQNQGRFEAWLNDMVSTNWVVYSKAPFGGPEDVVRYVGRYTHRVAISSSRIISIGNGIIRFTFKNYKKINEVDNYSDIWEEIGLTADEFIRRFLHHVLPLNFHRIRYFGFLGTCKKALRQEILEYLVFEEETGLPEITTEPYAGMPCSKCEDGIYVPIVIVDGSGNILNGSFSELSAFTKERKQLFKTKIKPLEDAKINDSQPLELVEELDSS